MALYTTLLSQADATHHAHGSASCDMNHSEFLKQKFAKAGVQGAAASWRGVGTPHTPASGWPPGAIPLLKPIEKAGTPVQKIRDDSCHDIAGFAA